MPAVKYPISIHFEGENFKTRGVPICELGETLVAIQRLLYRAYLEDKDIKRRTIRSIALRQKLALQIVSREPGSDIYNLGWFQTPGGEMTLTLLTGLLGEIIKVGGQYVSQFVLRDKPPDERIKPSKEAKAVRGRPADDSAGRTPPRIIDKRAIAYFNEFRDLANPVSKVGKIEALKVYIAGEKKPLVIDSDFLDYIREMDKYFYYDKEQEIEGIAERAHVYSRDKVEIQVGRHKKVTVYVTDDIFGDLLHTFTLRRRPKLLFFGCPIRRVGDIGASFSEFEANSYRVVK